MMITLTIDGRAHTFGPLVRVREIYARAGLQSDDRLLFAGDEPLEDLDQVLKFPACPYRTFESEAR